MQPPKTLRTDPAAADGFSLIELLIAASILVTVSIIFGAILFSVQRGLNQQTDRSINNDQVRLAIEQIDREVRSGNLLYNPQLESGLPSYSLRVYSQSNRIERCIQWAIVDRELLRRTWTSSDDVSGWRVVATGIVNADLSPPVAAFSLPSPSAPTGRTLNIVFYVNNRFDRAPEQTIRVEQSITGRNTTRTPIGNPCDPAPALGL